MSRVKKRQGGTGSGVQAGGCRQCEKALNQVIRMLIGSHSAHVPCELCPCVEYQLVAHVPRSRGRHDRNASVPLVASLVPHAPHRLQQVTICKKCSVPIFGRLFRKFVLRDSTNSIRTFLKDAFAIALSS